jgi:dienelactone hydrolase
MSCCPVTALPPTQGDGGVSGVLKTFNGTTLYVAAPASGTASVGIIAIPDIYGLDSGRTKTDAENLAKIGYAVAVVDVTRGDYLPPDDDMSGFKGWVTKNSFENVLGATIRDGIAFLQSEFHVTSIVSYGYCWGGYVGAQQTALAEPVVKGNVSFHPSWVIENLVNGDGAVEKFAERLNAPQLLVAAGDDPAFVRPNGSVHKILAAKPGAVGAFSNAVDFPAVNHGFVNRGDLEKPEVKAAVAEAWHTAIQFIQTVAPQQ